MRKGFTIITLLVLFFHLSGFAQVSEKGAPLSFTDNSIAEEFDYVDIQAPNMDQVKQEDGLDDKNGTFRKFARVLPTDLTMDNSGVWTELKSGGRLWRLKIHSEGALALAVYYKDFYLPPSSKLFLYNKNKKHVLGAYTEINNPTDGYFANELVQGEEVTLEYYEPEQVNGTARIHIDGIAYAYRDVSFRFAPTPKGFGDSDYCEININCSPEGDGWQVEKRGVVRILLVDGSQAGWCTGSLINNAKQDCTPYVLTADHCGETSTTSNYNQWIFYFNYESEDCNNPTWEPSSYSLTGCALKAHGGNGGNTGSDFKLIELNTSPPSYYDTYFNGWDRRNIISSSGVSIHHPAGDIKKISTYTSDLISYQWGSANGSHWAVYWASTTNGHGVTEGGSSGSPIFNAEKRIIGDLTGGSSYCTTPNNPDLYGKLSYSWQSNGTSASQRLKNWLDPDNTGIQTLNGKENSCGTSAPMAAFVASDTVVEYGSTINFTDLSDDNPHHWIWYFESATIDSSLQQNPYTVNFDSIGSFDVTLVVWNDYGYDTITYQDYITVVPQPADLDIISHTISQTTILEGDSVLVGATVKNLGQSTTIENNLKFYLSSNSSVSANDYLLDSINITPLNGLQSIMVEKNIQIPTGITPGNQYLIYSVDADNAVTESNENNNNALKLVTILEALPDFQLSQLSVDSSLIHPGANTLASCQVENTGNIEAMATDIDVYLSNDATLDFSSDELLQSKNTLPLQVGASDSVSFNLLIPTNTVAGDYFLLFAADANNNQEEISETNNIAQANLQVLPPLSISITQSDDEFQIWPNPNNGHFTVSIPAVEKDIFSFEIINIFGKTIFGTMDVEQSTKLEVKIEDLPKGIYFFRLKTEKKTKTIPFVIE